MLWFMILVWMVLLLSLLPTLVVLLQVVGSLLPKALSYPDQSEVEPATVVLIPAHNEGRGAAKTVRSARNASGPRTRILVVADNCQDDTADQARSAGAEVIERHDLSRRGKAYALGFGVDHLRAHPPEVVVVIDADSSVGGRIDRLASVARATGRPVQSLNLIDRRRTGDPHAVVQTLGNRFHNLVRPLGSAKLGWPCLLMGSGMAFPWQAIEAVGLENDSLGEDKQLGIDMTLAGFAPLFYPYTKVASYVPERYEAYLGQRTRWEHGHLLVAASIPKLLAAAWRRRSWQPLGIALDLCVPPIALQCLIWVTAMALAVAAWIRFQVWTPVVALLVIAAFQFLAFLVTWLNFSRRRVPNRDIFAVPGYILRKLPIYLRLITKGPQRVWLRSERPSETADSSSSDMDL
ncbi:MAG TPA: glycosyltransferase family 2 protein [Pirellulaceae bacterium]